MDNVLCTVPAVHNHQPRTSGEREGGRGKEGREGGRGKEGRERERREGGRYRERERSKLREEVGK